MRWSIRRMKTEDFTGNPQYSFRSSSFQLLTGTGVWVDLQPLFCDRQFGAPIVCCSKRHVGAHLNVSPVIHSSYEHRDSARTPEQRGRCPAPC